MLTQSLGEPAGAVLRRLLRVGSVRFSVYYFLPFYAPLVAAGKTGPAVLLGAALLCVLVCLGIELLNRYTDRVEDAINQPERTALCEAVGFDRIRNVAVAIFVALVPLGLLWYALWGTRQLFVLHAAVWLVAWSYSYGLRIKTRPLGSPLVLTLVPLLPFASSWAMSFPLADLPPAFLVAPAFLISVVGAKDLTDVAGDERVGYRSLFVRWLRSHGRRAALLSLPYGTAAVLVAAGSAPRRLLWFLAGAPFSAAFLVAVRRARTREELAAVREVAYHGYLAALSAVLLLTFPSAELALVVAGGAGAWLLATRFLHWVPGAPWRQLRTFAELAATRRAGR
jgi:4-hydroxybenzoate polyprenyltransferase